MSTGTNESPAQCRVDEMTVLQGPETGRILALLEQKLEELLSEQDILDACHFFGVRNLRLSLEEHNRQYRIWAYSSQPLPVPTEPLKKPLS